MTELNLTIRNYYADLYAITLDESQENFIFTELNLQRIAEAFAKRELGEDTELKVLNTANLEDLADAFASEILTKVVIKVDKEVASYTASAKVQKGTGSYFRNADDTQVGSAFFLRSCGRTYALLGDFSEEEIAFELFPVIANYSYMEMLGDEPSADTVFVDLEVDLSTTNKITDLICENQQLNLKLQQLQQYIVNPMSETDPE